MLDFLALIIIFFLISFLVFIILVGVKFFHNLVTIGQSNNSYSEEETDKQLREDSNEDSQGDGLVLFDDPLFPEERDNDDE
jgi:hypothetical protein